MNNFFLIAAISVIAFHNVCAMNEREEWVDVCPSGTKEFDSQREEEALHMLQYVLIKTNEARLKGRQEQFKIDRSFCVFENLLASRSMRDVRLRSFPLNTSFVASCSGYRQVPPDYSPVIQRGRKTRISPVNLRKGYRAQRENVSPDRLVSHR